MVEQGAEPKESEPKVSAQRRNIHFSLPWVSMVSAKSADESGF